MCLHMLSKFDFKPAQKWLIFPTKARYAKCLLLVFFMLFSFGAQAEVEEEEESNVSSTHADYDGNTLILKGNVLLEHFLGTMRAEEAFLEREENGKVPFSKIRLHQNVLLSLKNNSSLKAAEAHLDFILLHAVFCSSDTEKIEYKDHVVRGKKEIPLKLSSHKITLEMVKEKEGFDVAEVKATNNVTMDYGQDFSLNTHEAHYIRNKGIVEALPQEGEKSCLLHGKDLIEADKITLDLGASTLTLIHPEGAIYSLEESLTFSSDTLTWDEIANTLTLKDNIKLKESLFGTLLAEDCLEITKDEQGVRFIKTKGKTIFTYEDEKLCHTLTNFGSLVIDRKENICTMESPVIKGNTSQKLQLYYEQEEAGIFANKAHITYQETLGKLKPVELHLLGNIRLYSKDLKTRLAKADEIKCFPQKQTLMLIATPGKKVLFFDESEALYLSASEIHISRDPLTKKEIVRGIGNVRFTFNDEESIALKSMFQETHE